MAAPLCPIHGTPMVCFCPRCRGAKGGSVGGCASTPAKRRAAKRNAKQPTDSANRASLYARVAWNGCLRERLAVHPDVMAPAVVMEVTALRLQMAF